MTPHPYGWLSLLPPLVAILLAIATRRATVSLLVGLFCGVLITQGGNPWAAVHDLFEVHLWPTFTDPGKLRVFSFTLMMGGMIGVLCFCGGMQGLIGLISPFAQNRRKGQLITWLLGLLIFFDDYANSILLGNTLRPLCDRLKVSREKLAYLVDSTAAPVAGISLLSTWVAVEIDYVREGLETLGTATDLRAIDLFLGSIPYRFYVLSSLMLVPLIALTGRDFGPMLAAERRRLRNTIEDEADLHPVDELSEHDRQGIPPRWYNAVVPIVITLLVVMALLYKTGLAALAVPAGDPTPPLRDILGAAESSLALQYGALAGLTTALVMAFAQRLATEKQLIKAVGQGAKIVLPAIAILWFASSLSRMTGSRSVDGHISTTPFEFKDHRLYTGDYLTQFLIDAESQEEAAGGPKSLTLFTRLLPTTVFVLAAILSFATGTSFGTMGILLPIVISLAHSLLGTEGADLSATNPILLASVGGVLAGAVFGDHCSPISDTTILSSQASGCEHMAHVVTQLPYALLVGAVAILLRHFALGLGGLGVDLAPRAGPCVVAGRDLLRPRCRGSPQPTNLLSRRIAMLIRFVAKLPLACGVLLVAGLAETPGWCQQEAPDPAQTRPPVVLTDEARQLHSECLVVDGHNDLPWEIRAQGSLSFTKLDLAKPQASLQTDIPRLRTGGLDVQFWSVYVPSSTAYDGTALTATLEQIEIVHAMIDRYPETFELALTVDDIRRSCANGKIASLIGVEGGHSIENSLNVLRQLYRLGARYMTLTHADSLDWADSATDKPRHGGLTPFGEAVIAEMNRLGMLVDLSHVSPETMKHALRVTQAPVIFSHSSARAVAESPRNVPDDVLELVAKNGGVVMVNFFSGFVVPSAADRYARRLDRERELKATLDNPSQIRTELRRWENQQPSMERGTIHDLVDHIDHIIQVAGVDHVGIGSDFDGVSILPEQLDDVSSYPYITQALLDRGYAPADIRKIMGENLLRVMQETEQVAQRLQQ